MAERGSVAVIGAGIVGCAVARALQRSGRRVTLVDSEPPGMGTSFGNAGYIALDHVLPLSRPEVLLRVPRMLANPDAPLTIRWASIPWLLPWMLRFASSCRPGEVKRGIDALAALMAEANVAWQIEAQASGLADLFRRNGCLYVYETDAGFARSTHERELQREKGAIFEIVDGARAREIAPGLTPAIKHGVHYLEGAHTINPHRLVTALADRFVAEGGVLDRQRVLGFEHTNGRAAAIVSSHGRISTDSIVIAAGRASGALTRMLGFRAPLVAERGYHVMLAPDGVRFNLPVGSGERGFFITPMEDGLRLAGTVELSAPDEPPTWRRADLLERQTRILFPGVTGKVMSRWMGERPALPDFRPAIGRAPGFDNVYCAYGHHHVGLTLAAATGRLIVRIMDGMALDPALGACDPGRFG